MDRETEFDAVYAREQRRLFVIAFSVLRDRDEAADAVQETMWQAYQHWSDLRESGSRSAWLTQICVRHCVRRRPRLHRWFSALSDSTDTVAQPAKGPGRAEVLDLDRAWRSLPRQQRMAIFLHYRGGYTIEECAELMGNSPGTIRTHVQRALARLRKELGDEQ